MSNSAISIAALASVQWTTASSARCISALIRNGSAPCSSGRRYVFSAAALASAEPVNAAQGAASPQPTIPASVPSFEQHVGDRTADIADTVGVHGANRQAHGEHGDV